MQIQDQLNAILEPVVTGLGYELVGIEYRPNVTNGLLRIYIDKEDGIDVDDCAQVSRQVSGVLDVEDPITGQYNLEVSSPGINRPLFKLEDYQQFSGNKAKIHLNGLYEGRRKVVGTLQGIDVREILIEVDGEQVKVPFDQIAKARLIYEA